MTKPDFKDYTNDGFEIVYISEYFFQTLDRELMKIARHSGEKSPYPTSIIRDEPARVEFRRLEKR